MRGSGWYWRGFTAEVLVQKAAAVFTNGILGRGAVSPIEHVWMRGLRNRLFTRSSLQHQRVLEVLCYVVDFGVTIA